MYIVTFPTIIFKTDLTFDIGKTSSGNVKEIVARCTNNWSTKHICITVIKPFGIINTIMRNTTITYEILFLYFMREIFGPLFKS